MASDLLAFALVLFIGCVFRFCALRAQRRNTKEDTVPLCRRLEHARLALVILVTLLISLGIQDVSRNYDIIIFIAPVIALILAQPGWIVASAVTILGSLLFRANGAGVYADTSNLLEFAVIIAGLMFSRLATDNTKRLAEVHAQVEHALRQAEHQGSQHCISPDSPCLRLASWREYGMIAPAAIVGGDSAATI